MSEQADTRTERSERSIRARQTVRVVVVLVVLLVLVAWAVANAQEVEVDWLFDTTEAPLVAVIGASAALGFVIGALTAWRRQH